MAETDYKFMVYSDTLTAFGTVGKENLDVLRLKYDFTCYLETGESVSEIMFPTIAPVPQVVQQNRYWKQDYPPDGTTTTGSALPPDDYTLTVVSEAITGTGNEIDIRLTAGTPGYTYVMTFVAVGSTTRRRKQVDTTVYINPPLNPSMVGPGTLNPDIVPPIVVNGSIALPVGFNGLVILENSGNSTSLVLTLPPSPVMGQLVDFIDALGKDGLYPVTFRADADGPLDGDGSTVFVSITAYEALRFVWTGNNWHMEPQRFGFLG